jgi:hypothetical protein
LAFLLSIVASMAVVTLSDQVVLVGLAFVTIGAATAFLYSGSLYYSLEGQGEDDHMTGWHEGILAAGGASGLLLAGFAPRVLQWWNVGDSWWQARSPYLAAGAVFALGLVVQVVIYLRRPRTVSAGADG